MATAENSRIWGTILLTITIFSLSLPVHAKYNGGTGESNNPYLIFTPEQMNEIGLHEEDWDKQFKLIADIDLSAYKGSTFNIIGTLGSRLTPAKPFTGVFDGNEHVIWNFTYTAEGHSYIGFFRYINGPNAEIRNLGLIDPNVTGKECSYVGSLVGFLGSGTITNCYVKDGIISGDNEIGGLVGINSGTITHCSVKDCTVSGDREIGGLVGQSSNGTVTDCCCTGTVGGNNSIGGLIGSNTDQGTVMNSSCTIIVIGSESVGGLVGHNGYGIIKDCYSDSSVDGVSTVGGLVGHNDDRIINSYSSANVIGQQDVGGLVGQNTPPPIMDPITNCYSTGTVDGEVNVGGLVGFNFYPERVTRSFWDVQVSGQEHSAGGEGKTTTQMQTAVTFLAWAASDNEGTWTIDEGNDYPRLWWEGAPGTTIEIARLEGMGTEDDPYLIYTVHELSSIGLLSLEWDKHFKLMADIDLSVHTGTTFNIIQRFSGIFDGNGHVISNLTYTLQEFKYPDFNEPFFPNVSHVGLFGNVGGLNAEIKNLGLVNPNVNAGTGDYVGALAGYVGGIGTTIADCSVDGGTVTGGGWWGVGGLVGHNESGAILKCYATAAVFGDSAVGGLVGYNDMYGNVTDCYAGGNITGNENVGGLAGSNLGGISFGGRIMNCYSTGHVNGNDHIGGLVAYCPDQLGVFGCFWDVETSAQEVSAGGLGLTTAEMQSARTFRGWAQCDEETTWTIDDGNDYPRLAWENQPGKPIAAIPLSDFLAGSGTEDDPYLIYTAEDLCLVGRAMCDWDKHFRLMVDIDLYAYKGPEFDTIGITSSAFPFAGVFDGNGHAIANFNYTCTNATGAGLFGYVHGPITGPNAEIRNLRLIDPNVGAGSGNCVGSLIGYLTLGGAYNCYVEGGTVSGGNQVGGLAGRVNGGSIIECYTKGRITGNDRVGGIVGEITGSVTNSYCEADIIGSNDVGGLVGYNSAYGHITDCYAEGRVAGIDGVGGIAGCNGFSSSWNEYPGTITRCYCTCKVSGNPETTGGLLGLHILGEVTSSFWDIETSGQDTSAGGTGKTTAEMQTATTFIEAGWDFVGETDNGTEDSWWIIEGQEYPHLWWELIPEN